MENEHLHDDDRHHRHPNVHQDAGEREQHHPADPTSIIPPRPQPSFVRRRVSYHRTAGDEDYGFVSEPSESTREWNGAHNNDRGGGRPQHGSPGTTSLSSVPGDETTQQHVVMQFVMPETQYTRRKTPELDSMTLSDDDDDEQDIMVHNNLQKQASPSRMTQQQQHHASFRQSSVRSLQSVEEDRPLEDYSAATSDDDEAYIHTHRLAAAELNSSLDHVERLYETNEYRGSEQAVLRSHAKTTERTIPSTLPTYICPRCGTRQREFFTTDNVAGSFEGPASYLALYFSIYVICSLFIFGLEEGWMPLDCIYFAVLTLTTAGLYVMLQ